MLNPHGEVLTKDMDIKCFEEEGRYVGIPI
jgi:hypothetical protein